MPQAFHWSRFIVLDFLRCADQGGVENRTRFDLLDLLLSFLNQSFHRDTLDALELDATLLDDLIDSLDLAMPFLQVGLESCGQIGTGRGASQLGERLRQLLLRAIKIRRAWINRSCIVLAAMGNSLGSER
ncbi:MAG: hypothetical protein JWR14_3421 [Caballeronia sp.]|jgi:hypothetical protein|nr:hypothetical protein [Caballeronia sp.]